MDGEFVEKCLWMPRLLILGTRKMAMYRPLPISSNKAPMEAYLDESGNIELAAFELQLTLNCLMDFHRFPFDDQVRVIMI